jgi:hypothetical protein
MKKWMRCSVGFLMVAAALAGCSQPGPAPEKNAAATPSAAPDASFILTELPADAQEVGAAIKGDGEDITVVGLIGGSRAPFVADLAAFTIVDTAIPYCSKDEGCPTPWDYCCKTNELKGNTALVKVIGADGNVVSKDARALLGVKELSKVVVKGKAQRDTKGNLTILAQKVHVTSE